MLQGFKLEDEALLVRYAHDKVNGHAMAWLLRGSVVVRFVDLAGERACLVVVNGKSTTHYSYDSALAFLDGIVVTLDTMISEGYNAGGQGLYNVVDAVTDSSLTDEA